MAFYNIASVACARHYSWDITQMTRCAISIGIHPRCERRANRHIYVTTGMIQYKVNACQDCYDYIVAGQHGYTVHDSKLVSISAFKGVQA